MFLNKQPITNWHGAIPFYSIRFVAEFSGLQFSILTILFWLAKLLIYKTGKSIKSVKGGRAATEKDAIFDTHPALQDTLLDKKT